MFASSKLLLRARVGASRTHVRIVGGAATLAIAATITAGAIVTAEPASAEQPAAATTPAPATTENAPVSVPAPVSPVVPSPPAAVQKAAREPVVVVPAPPPPPVYEDNLDGWIRQSLDILASNNIPASYDGIMRNVMRESTGNPQAINLYDSNAAAGIPSKGLLQVIDPTFAAYHVEGTAFDIWNPVSNIVAACNYAAHNYGSMDNVNSAY